VQSFEAEYKEQRIKDAMKEEKKSEFVENKIPIPNKENYKSNEKSPVPNKDNYKSNEKEIIDQNTKSSSKNSSKNEEKLNVMNLSKEKIAKESINQQKTSQINDIINTNKQQNEFSLFGDSKDTLFDKVLNQVQGKNKSKKKKKEDGVKDSPVIEEKPEKPVNKIVLIAEKPKEQIKPSKEEVMDANNFSILKEISDFENKITELENNNKKFEENRKQSEENRKQSLKVSNEANEREMMAKAVKKNQESSKEFNLLGRDEENNFNSKKRISIKSTIKRDKKSSHAKKIKIISRKTI